MNFNSNISGSIYKAGNSNTFVYTLTNDGIFHGVSTGEVTSGGKVNRVEVVLTGWQTISMRSGTIMSQIVRLDSGQEWIDLDEGWYDTGYMMEYPTDDAQRYVNKVIENNKHILQNNLVCARFSHHLTDAQKQRLYNLQTRLNLRNQSLLSDGLVAKVETSQPAGFAELESSLQTFMQNYAAGVGVVLTTTAVIVIVAVVAASLATAAYFAYKAFAAESDADVRYSDELTRALISKLTPEEYEQLMKETKGIVTKARLKSLVSGSTTTIKLILLAVAGIAVAYAIRKKL